MKKFAKTHEWVEIADGIATVGISQFAADELKTLTYVELPDKGRAFAAAEAFGSVESTKSANEIFAPVAGTVCEVNMALETDPEMVNRDAEGAGWIIKLDNVDAANLDNLMTKEEYLEFVK